MIIADSSIGMDSARTYTSVSMKGYSSSGTLFAFPELLTAADQAKSKQDVSDPEKISGEDSPAADAGTAKNDFDGIFNKMKAYATSGALEKKLQRDAMDRIRVECIQFLLYMLFGAKGCLDDVEMPQSEGKGGSAMVSTVTETYRYFHSESEETCFSTTGCVKTAEHIRYLIKELRSHVCIILIACEHYQKLDLVCRGYSEHVSHELVYIGIGIGIKRIGKCIAVYAE